MAVRKGIKWLASHQINPQTMLEKVEDRFMEPLERSSQRLATIGATPSKTVVMFARQTPKFVIWPIS